MHLSFERNIEIPGSFVVLQGIPGDGLLNTIDSSPDFVQHANDNDAQEDTADAGQSAPRNETHDTTNTPTLASPSSLGTFLGQGIPSLMLPGSSMISSPLSPQQTRSLRQAPASLATPATPTSTANATNHPQQRQSGGGGDEFVLVDDNDENEIHRQRSLPLSSSRNMAIPAHVQRSIDHWKDECIASQTANATEWLEAVMQQQKLSSDRSRTHDTVPILSRIVSISGSSLPTSQRRRQRQQNPRWWLHGQTAQLRVFSTLPCPIPNEADQGEKDERDSVSLPPGTTLVGIALHTFDLQVPASAATSSASHNPDTVDPLNWTYNGQCTNFRGQESNGSLIPNDHVPCTGRIQYLHVESPVQGYLLFSVDGYAVLAPGLPSSCLFTGRADDNHSSISSVRKPDHTTTSTITTPIRQPSRWWWKVTCHEGAVVRQGLDLHTPAIATLPYGTHVQVLRKVVNAVGLSRLLVRAHPHNQPRVDGGWCSECLNPMAGQRGPILQPVPLAVPAIYQIRQPCTVRAEVELSSAAVRQLDFVGATVPVLRRVFTEFPAQNCLPRLQLAPGAYASLRLNTTNYEDLSQIILHPTGETDGSFDPETPGLYHWQIHGQWRTRLRTEGDELSGSQHLATPTISSSPPAGHPPSGVAAPAAAATSADLSSVESGSCASRSRASSSASSSSRTRNKTLASSQSQQQQELCMCCEDKAVNATLVHGQTGHICVCLDCGRILQAQGLGCPICRLPIDNVILHFYS